MKSTTWWAENGDNFTMMFEAVKDIDLRVNVNAKGQYFDPVYRIYRSKTTLRKKGKNGQIASLVWRWNHPDNAKAQINTRGYPNELLEADLVSFYIRLSRNSALVSKEDTMLEKILAAEKVRTEIGSGYKTLKVEAMLEYYGLSNFYEFREGVDTWTSGFLRDIEIKLERGNELSPNQLAKLGEILTPATEKQMEYLLTLGYEGTTILSILQAPTEIKRRVEALGEIGDERAVEPSIAILKNDGETCKVRMSAAKALGKIGDERAIEPLIEVLENDDDHESVRSSAAEALGEIGDERAVEPSIAILKNDGETCKVRMSAAKALGKIGDERAIEPLIEVLENDGETCKVRMSAATALGEIGDERAVEPLIEVLKYKNNRFVSVRIFAVRALGEIGDERAVEPLIVLLKDEDLCDSAIEALGEIGDERAVEPLKELLKNENLARGFSIAELAADAIRLIEEKKSRMI